MTVLLQATNGLCMLDGGDALLAALEDALAMGLHLGTTWTRATTAQAALDVGDPVWCSRVVRAHLQGSGGWLANPLAPRAAVGPDLACFAIGTRARAQHVTVRAEQAAGWVRQSFDALDKALASARTLQARGCTLVELHGAPASLELVAALPRPGAGRTFTLGPPPTLHPHVVQHWRVAGFEEVPRLWSGVLQLSVLDSHRVALSCIAPEAPWPTVALALPAAVRAAFSPGEEDRHV
jgi:hypothetical protein